MRYILIALALTLFSSAMGYQYWNQIRHSALLPDDEIAVRVENPAGSGVENSILYMGNGIIETPMTYIIDGPSTLSATVPGPVLNPGSYGFKFIEGNGDLHLFPILIQESSDPGPEDLTLFVTDPSGDEPFGYSNLDLVECRFSFSGSKLFASLTNTGGGFPVNAGLTFFGYLFAITDPAETSPDTVLALLYTINQPGVMSPGLYKITGTGFSDLEKIGEIEYQEYPSANSILLSCQISDLMADPYFTSWFDQSDPAIAAAAFTQKITLLGGAQQSDLTSGGCCYLRELSIDPEVNQYPEISGPVFSGTGAQASVSLDYFDQNGNFPVISEVQFDGGTSYPMYPLSLDYGTTVVYETEEGIDPLSSGTWNSAVFSFSDDMVNYTFLEAYNTGISQAEADGQVEISVFPNPSTLNACFTFSAHQAGYALLGIYDVRGVLVRKLVDGFIETGTSEVTWDGRSTSGEYLGTGMYLARLQLDGTSATCSMVLLR